MKKQKPLYTIMPHRTPCDLLVFEVTLGYPLHGFSAPAILACPDATTQS